MKGIRVYPEADGWLDSKKMNQPGAYGRVDIQKVVARKAEQGYPIDANHPWCHWQVCCPDGNGGRLDPSIHNVIEHDDDTITVSPSIDMSKRIPGAYHGYLMRGEWT